MHSPSARAWRNLNRYCIILVCTLKYAKPAKCVLSVLLRYGDLSANQMCGTHMKLLTELVCNILNSSVVCYVGEWQSDLLSLWPMMLKCSFVPLPYQRTRQLLQNGGCVYGTSGRRDKDGLTVVLGQPSGNPLQHPHMTQVHAVEAHELAIVGSAIPAGLGHSVPPSWQEPV